MRMTQRSRIKTVSIDTGYLKISDALREARNDSLCGRRSAQRCRESHSSSQPIAANRSSTAFDVATPAHPGKRVNGLSCPPPTASDLQVLLCPAAIN